MVLDLFLFDTAMKLQHKPYSLKEKKKCKLWNEETLEWWPGKTVNKCLLASAEAGFYVISVKSFMFWKAMIFNVLNK